MTLPAIGPWSTSGQSAPHVVFINDNVASTQYILEPDRKIARQTKRFRGGRQVEAHRPTQNLRPANGAGGTNRRPNVTTTSLGTQTINGVQAEGTRTTRTIPAGAIGNANPIVITNERWYSPDLQTVRHDQAQRSAHGRDDVSIDEYPKAGAGRVAVSGAVRLHREAGTERIVSGAEPDRPAPPPPPQE